MGVILFFWCELVLILSGWFLFVCVCVVILYKVLTVLSFCLPGAGPDHSHIVLSACFVKKMAQSYFTESNNLLYSQ